MNVRPLLILLTPLLISSCSWIPKWNTVDPITIQKQAVERTKLNLAEPQPVKPTAPKWIIVTPDNIDAVWKQLKDENVDLALFALTDEGYEGLAINIAELRNFVSTQRAIILRYKQYYEPVEKTENKK